MPFIHTDDHRPLTSKVRQQRLALQVELRRLHLILAVPHVLLRVNQRLAQLRNLTHACARIAGCQATRAAATLRRFAKVHRQRNIARQDHLVAIHAAIWMKLSCPGIVSDPRGATIALVIPL